MSDAIFIDAPSTYGAEATSREILQQPEVWLVAAKNVELQRSRLDAFLRPLLARPELRIILTGAGTSAFAGEVAAPMLARLIDHRVEAIATTDIVSNPHEYLAEDLPTLLVSFARSGNSPESSAATRLADEVLNEVYHLVLTCDRNGRLFADHQGRADSLSVLMPEPANDEGFAMTSSFTSMLLSALLILGGDAWESVKSLSASAAATLSGRRGRIEELAARDIERVVFLGSGPLTGLARESALKLLELTAGAVVAYHDSSLGFRHGPKSVLNDRTLVVAYVSADPYTRQYDLDIIAELRSVVSPGNLVVVAATPLPPESSDLLIAFPWLDGLDDALIAVAFVLVAQVLALALSLKLGLTPDNPFPSGVVNRVVQGVRIHHLDGA